jgi:hypothetical protein
VPAGLIEDEHGMGSRIDGLAEFNEVLLHGCGVAPGTPQLDVMRCRVLASTCQSASTRPDRSNLSLASLTVSTNSANADSVNDRESTKPTPSRLVAATVEDPDGVICCVMRPSLLVVFHEP